jgi:N-acetylglutamate synthase-like GNAT family acetyltransferase
VSDAYFIRTASPEDFEAVGALLLASYSSLLAGHYDGGVLEAALPFLSRANTMLLASGAYYVAQTDAGALVGCGGWSLAPPGDGEIVAGEGHVRHVAIHPGWGRRRIGASLLARCFADAETQAQVRIFHCYASLNAVRFYQACGFEIVGLIDMPMGPDLKFPSVLMTRRLVS